ncbi:uncharacterized protein LOC122506973 [Leptopilina heterotoma]|uniref:uncharacterized protein LOC122506973 n=1 Tax=Leptopilina heterotoma TaxID=63436 RepID=UPI001CAA3306|nr:uncharacterized protein LOC122506973 [Leptopilina heterotoma]
MTTLKGIFPDPKPSRRKNFIQENVKSLRKMEQYFHNKNIEDLKNLHLHKQQKAVNKYQNVTSKVNSTFKVGEVTGNKSYSNLQGGSKTEKFSSSCKKLNGGDVFCKDASFSSSKKLSKSHEMYNSMPQGIGKLRQVQRVPIRKNKFKSNENIVQSQFENSEIKKNDVKLRNQGCQTMDDNKLENLYTEGVIRYATKKDSKDEKQPITSDSGDCNSPVKNENTRIDFIKLNKERKAVGNKAISTINNSVPPSSYRKGVVPKYIQERKEALKKEEQAKIEASIPSDCPPGHIPIPDDERKESLHMLKKRYEKYVTELNKLPIRNDTLRAQRKKIEIERELMKLEEGIKVFSRPKVFIQVDA